MRNLAYKLIYYFQFINFFISRFLPGRFNEKKHLKTILNEQSIVFDVGSNLGSFIKTVLKIRNIEIHSFEPQKQILEIQKKNIKEKTNVHFNNLAISDFEGQADFYIRNIPSFSSLEIMNFSKFHKITATNKVNVSTIEKYVEQNKIDKIDLLKIDTEGSELKILQNIENLLNKRFVKNIKVEIVKNKNLGVIFNYLYKHNFELIGITNKNYEKNKFFYADAYFTLV